MSAAYRSTSWKWFAAFTLLTVGLGAGAIFPRSSKAEQGAKAPAVSRVPAKSAPATPAQASRGEAKSARATRALAARGTRSGLRPLVRRDLKHDTSIPLRDMKFAPPTPGEPREIPLHRPPLPLGGKIQPQPFTTDPLLDRGPVQSNMPAPLLAFEGGSDDDNEAVNGFRVVPPDTNGDVGPSHYVQYLNLIVTMYNKDGTVAFGPAPGNIFWTGFGGFCEANNDGDPIVLYDQLADRWMASQFSPFDGIQCVAVSTTGDPTGSYHQYAFQLNSSFNDYPKFGVWPDPDNSGYYLTWNDFSAGFTGVGFAAFERDQMLVGGSAQMVQFGPILGPGCSGAGDCYFSLQPSDLDGLTPPPAGSPNYFIMSFDDETWSSAPDPTQDFYKLWEFDVDWTIPADSTLTGPSSIPTAEFDAELCGFGSCAPQPSPGELLDTLSQFTMFRLVYRNFTTHEALWISHTVDVADPDQGGIRWAEIRDPGAAPAVYQAGTFGPADGLFRWMPSLAVDASGNMAVCYSASSTSEFPSARCAGRLVSDPLGELTQGEAEYWDGTGAQTSSFNRWGDYSMTTIDPVDDCTFWSTQEHYNVTGSFDFNTSIFAFTFAPACSSTAGTLQGTVTDNLAVPLEGAQVQAGAASTFTAADGTYSMTLAAGTYDVTASAYGYFSQTVTGVVIIENMTTTQDFALAPAPSWLVDGTVTDGSGHGWPLYARIDISGAPVGPVFTNPFDGTYSVDIVEGTAVTLNVNAISSGYNSESSAFTVLPGGRTEDFALTVDGTCSAPGYGLGGLAGGLFEQFESGIPPTWTVIVNGPDPNVFWIGSASDACSRPNNTGGSGLFAIFDSDCYGLADGGLEDSELRTPIINFSGTPTVVLDFDMDYDALADIIDVDVSSDGGTNWTNVFQSTTDMIGPVHQTIDISALAGNQLNVVVRFHHYSASWAWWWKVDNVRIAPPAAGFSDDFEGGLGNWTTSGLWNPENQGDACGAIVAPFPSPTNDAYYGQDGICNFDVGTTSGSLTLITPAGITPGAQLTFWSYEQTECGGPSCPYDARLVELSTDGGANWALLGEGTVENTWYQNTFDLSAFAGQSANIRFRFDSLDDIGNAGFGWMVDSVDISANVCVPVPGGLLVGNTFDANTGAGLNGSTVASDNAPSDTTTSFSTPDDPAVDEGLYILFSSLTGANPFTASKSSYGSDTQSPTVAADAVVQQDFNLTAGFIVPSPNPLEVTVDLNATLTVPLTLDNTGGNAADFALQEGEGLAFGPTNRPNLPRARAEKPRQALTGPASVRSLKDLKEGERERVKRALFPGIEPNVWIGGAALPGGIVRYAHAQCDDQPNSFYVISGVDGGFSVTNNAWRYDADTNTWNALAPIPIGGEAPTGVCFAGRIYVMGGSFDLTSLQIYDIATDTWLTGATVPRASEGAAAGAFNDQVYLIGGDDDFSPGSGVSGVVNIYDIASNTWIGTGTSMPTGTGNAGFVQAGSFVYVVGGWGAAAPGSNVDATQRYDMASDTWETGPTYTSAHSDLAVAASVDALYAMGGDANGGSFFEATTTVERLDLAAWPGGAWTDLGDPLPTALTANQAGFCTVFFGGEVWSTGGLDPGFTITGTNQYWITGEACPTASVDVPWLSEIPVSGTIPANDFVVVDVTFDATAAAGITQPGDFEAHLRVTENTPYPAPEVNVIMHVPLPLGWGTLNGTVNGLGRCDVPTGVLEGATVFVDAVTDDFTLTTDAAGSYTISMDVATNTPVDVTVSAGGFVGQTATVDLVLDGIVTQDFTLRLDAPCGDKTPASFDVTLPEGTSTTQPLTLTNAGAGALTFLIQETTFPLPPARPAGRRDYPIIEAAPIGPTSVRSLTQKPGGEAPIPEPSLWTFGSSLPGGIVRYAHAQCDNSPDSFYVISGVDGSFSLSTNTWRYDASTNTWNALAPIPAGQEAPIGVCYLGNIYVMGGGGTNQHFIYDIASDTWSTGASVPRGVEGAAAGAFNGKVYLIGGDDDFFPGSGVSDEVNIYDIVTDTWLANGAAMPIASGNAGTFQTGPFVYVVGGWGISSPTSNVAATQRYDMTTDTWEAGPDMLSPRADLALAATDTALYAIGGDADGSGFFDGSDVVERLDVTAWPAGAWTDTGDPLPVVLSANQAGFCTEAEGGSEAEVWSTGGIWTDFFIIVGFNSFAPTPGEQCFSIFTDVPWLSESPDSGSVAADSAGNVDVTFDASALTAGVYTATLTIDTNDPGAAQFRVPVTLTVFVPPTFTVDVSLTGAGTGTVTSVPAGITCGADCTEVYTGGTVVTLTATAAQFSTFNGWSGACTGADPCVVTTDATVTANFIIASGDNSRFKGRAKEAGSGVPGISIVGATISAFQGGVLVSTTTTGAGGLYELDVPAGTYDLVATHPSYQTLTKTGLSVAAGARTKVKFKMVPLP